MQKYCRVVLSGYGGDPDLLSSSLYAFEMLKDLQVWQLLQGVWWFMLYRRKLPQFGIRTALRKLRGTDSPWQPPYPSWLNPNLMKRLDLVDRWRAMTQEQQDAAPGREPACAALDYSFWQHRFQSLDPGVTSFPIEELHPFFDLRLVRFLTGLPVLPWSLQKCILRVCSVGILPECIRLRPKVPLRGHPLFEQMREVANSSCPWNCARAPELEEYVDWANVPAVVPDDPYELWVNLRPVSLNEWLRQQ